LQSMVQDFCYGAHGVHALRRFGDADF